MYIILWLLLVLNISALWQIIAQSSILSSVFPIALQLSVTLGWIALFTFAILRYGKSKSRVIWLICGFILYSAVRLVLFAQTDYDRQRAPFLLMTAFIITGFMLAVWLVKARRGHQKKEKFTDDRQPENT